MKYVAYIGIGSNLGDRLANCERAVELLKQHNKIEVVAVSSWYETEAVTLNQEREPSYINGAIKISTTLSPQELLESLKTIETQMGRPAHHPKWSSRTIDLDILFYDDLAINLNPPSEQGVGEALASTRGGTAVSAVQHKNRRDACSTERANEACPACPPKPWRRRERSRRVAPTRNISPLIKGGEGGLIIPHPEIEKRMFVLKPLCDIAPELLHPVLKMKIKDLYLNIG